MQTRKLALLCACALSLLPRAVANDIEPGKETYTASKAGGAIVIDGDLSEWGGVPVLSDPRFSVPKGSGDNGRLVFFEPYQGGSWTSPDDHTSAVQIVWDADNIYLGVVVTDEYHVNTSGNAWNGDSAQMLFTDGPLTAYTDYYLYNYALGGTEDAPGDVIVGHERGPGGTEGFVVRNPETKRTIYEIKIPATALNLTGFTAGQQLGVGMAINDGDVNFPGQGGWGGWGAHSIVFGKTPAEAGLLTLGTNLPVEDRIFLSAINPTISGFTFRATDKGLSIVSTNTAKLVIDGQQVTLVASPKVNEATDFTYTRPTPFPPGTQHTYSIEIKDTRGNTVTSEGNFQTELYALLAPGDKVNPNVSQPGFIWRVHQNDALRENSIARALNQLAGLLGENFADTNAQGIAIALGTPGANTNLPIQFEIETVINLNQDAALEQNGDVMPDDQMPGIPGFSGDGLNGIAGEIITFLELPAGKHTLVVNSDDGFRTTAGNINDVFLAQKAGEFDDPAGRGAADTAFTVFVQEAGVYAFRTVYQEGGGGANIEFKSRNPDDTEVLINDTASGGIKAYRVAAGLPTGISFVAPQPGATNVALNSPIVVQITEGATAVDLNSVKLSIGGSVVAATPVKADSTITVRHQPASVFASLAQPSVSLAYTSGGIARTQTWTFTVENYATLTKAHQAVSVDKTKPGFIWRVFQNEATNATTLAVTEQALAGQLTSDGAPLPNLADTNIVGIAADVGVADGPLMKFEIPGVINLSQVGGTFLGNFTPDDQMPGIPGLNGLDNGIYAELIAFLELPAGLMTMGVNSDDGFRTQAGYINAPADGIILGQFDAGRGAADTLFKFVVAEAGVYPFRTIWNEGGGDANIEWFTLDAAGTRVLLNDEANGGIKAYRAGVAPNKAAAFNIGILKVAAGVEITWTEPGVTLQQSTDLRNWSDVAGAASPYKPTLGTQAFFRLKK